MLPAARGCRPSGFPLCFSSVPCACCRCRSVRLSVPAAAVFLPLMISEKVYAVLASLFFVMHPCLKHLFLCVSSCSVPAACASVCSSGSAFVCVFSAVLCCCPLLLLSASPLPVLRCSPAGSPPHPLRTVRPFLWGDGSRSDGCGLLRICPGFDCR